MYTLVPLRIPVTVMVQHEVNARFVLLLAVTDERPFRTAESSVCRGVAFSICPERIFLRVHGAYHKCLVSQSSSTVVLSFSLLESSRSKFGYLYTPPVDV